MRKFSLLVGQPFTRFFIASILGVLFVPQSVCAQDAQLYKAGVVRIHNTKLNEVGAGFIIKIDKDRAYIITAAHVVKGNEHPRVYFFNRQNDSLQADLLDREEDDQKGLALLLVKADRETMKGVVSLKLGNPSVKGGESVNVVGFPDGATLWSVTPASISRLEGRGLVFSGSIRGGNSGGPVLFNGQVIGLVTDTIQDSAYAVRAENIPIYIKGVPQVANLLKEGEAGPGINVGSSEHIKFCQAMNRIVEASRNDFSGIINEKTSSYGDLFDSSITLPGTSSGSIFLESKYFRASAKNDDKSGSEYYKLVSKTKLCLPKWKQTDFVEPTNSRSDLKVLAPSDSRTYQFTEDDNGVVVEINQRKSSIDSSYHTEVIIYARDSSRKSKYLGFAEDKIQSFLDIISDEDKVDEVCQTILKLVDASHTDFYSIVKPSGVSGIFNSSIQVRGFPNAQVRPRDNVEFSVIESQNGKIETLYYRLIALVRRCLPNWTQKETSSPLNARHQEDRSFQFLEGEAGSIVEIRFSKFAINYLRVSLTVYSPNSPKWRK